MSTVFFSSDRGQSTVKSSCDIICRSKEQGQSCVHIIDFICYSYKIHCICFWISEILLDAHAFGPAEAERLIIDTDTCSSDLLRVQQPSCFACMDVPSVGSLTHWLAPLGFHAWLHFLSVPQHFRRATWPRKDLYVFATVPATINLLQQNGLDHTSVGVHYGCIIWGRTTASIHWRGCRKKKCHLLSTNSTSHQFLSCLRATFHMALQQRCHKDMINKRVQRNLTPSDACASGRLPIETIEKRSVGRSTSCGAPDWAWLFMAVKHCTVLADVATCPLTCPKNKAFCATRWHGPRAENTAIC